MPKALKSRWYRSKVKRALDKGMARNLDMAAIYTQGFIRSRFPDSGVSGGRSGATRGQRAANRSRPWGIPHVDTGHLRRNVGWDAPSKLRRRVGTGIGNKKSVKYAQWLEFGTRRMLPRPWLRPGVYYARPMVKRILKQKVKL